MPYAQRRASFDEAQARHWMTQWPAYASFETGSRAVALPDVRISDDACIVSSDRMARALRLEVGDAIASPCSPTSGMDSSSSATTSSATLDHLRPFARTSPQMLPRTPGSPYSPLSEGFDGDSLSPPSAFDARRSDTPALDFLLLSPGSGVMWTLDSPDDVMPCYWDGSRAGDALDENVIAFSPRRSAMDGAVKSARPAPALPRSSSPNSNARPKPSELLRRRRGAVAGQLVLSSLTAVSPPPALLSWPVR